VIHRDFKPTNAMVGNDGRVRVLDFGLARGAEEMPSEEVSHRNVLLSADITEADDVIGTPPYMAPEQHVGDPVDGRADQYALCVALFEALYGGRPFVGDTLRELADAKLEGRIARIEDMRVPRRLRRVLERGLAPEPMHRFESMDALADALARVLRGRRWNPLATLGAGATIAAALLTIPMLSPAPARSVTVAAALPSMLVEPRECEHLAALLEREADAWATRAEAARRDGRLGEALAAAERALELFVVLHGDEHPASVAARTRVGVVVHEIRSVRTAP
jgi:hypothetical protein